MFTHPTRDAFVVLAHGQGYVVDPATRRVLETIGPGICAAAQDASRLVLATDTNVVVFDHDGRWNSPRVAWDGIADLHITGETLIGMGRDALIDDFREIEIDLATRAVLRSAYEPFGRQ